MKEVKGIPRTKIPDDYSVPKNTIKMVPTEPDPQRLSSPSITFVLAF